MLRVIKEDVTNAIKNFLLELASDSIKDIFMRGKDQLKVIVNANFVAKKLKILIFTSSKFMEMKSMHVNFVGRLLSKRVLKRGMLMKFTEKKIISIVNNVKQFLQDHFI